LNGNESIIYVKLSYKQHNIDILLSALAGNEMGVKLIILQSSIS
jgi:hypothetical protein